MSKNAKLAIVGVGAVAFFVILIFFLLSDPGEGGGSAGGKAGRKNRFGFSMGGGPGAIDSRKILADYKKYSIYPPASRPLKRNMVDLLKPNSRYESFLPVSMPPKKGLSEAELRKTMKKASHYFRLTGDRYYVLGEESIKVELRAAERRSENADRVKVRIIAASLHKGRSHLDFRQKKVQDLRLNDQGLEGDEKAGDMIYRVDIKPSRIAALSRFHGRCQIYVKFEVEGRQAEALIPFEYQPASEIPAVFTGEFSDRVEQGSLVITAEVNVRKAGYFVFDANLFDSQDVPVAYTRAKVELKGGRQKVKLLFFGKVIRDADPRGPFVLKNLRGRRNKLGKKPPKLTKKTAAMFKTATTFEQIIPWYTKTYRTRREYRDLTVFSNNAWTSPQKIAKIKFLENESKAGTRSPERVGK